MDLDTSDNKEAAAATLGLFTSSSPSGYLLKFGKNTGMSLEEARQIIQQEDNVSTFVQAFDNDRSRLNVFGFDSCLNECYGHRQINLNN